MGKKNRLPPFVPVLRHEMKTDAWARIGHPAVRVLLHLRAKSNGSNESELVLTYEEMRPFMKPATFKRAMDQLVEEGFVRVVRRGGLMRHCNLYALPPGWKERGPK